MPSIISQEDLDDVLKLIRPMVGEPCLRAGMSYGTELYLEFKQILPKQLADWTITTRASDWYIQQHGEVIVTSDEDYDVLEEKCQCLVGHKIQHINIRFTTLALVIEFDSGYIFVVEPYLDEMVEDLCDWRIFTPEGMSIEMGPDRYWDYVPLD